MFKITVASARPRGAFKQVIELLQEEHPLTTAVEALLSIHEAGRACERRWRRSRNSVAAHGRFLRTKGKAQGHPIIPAAG
jgi:hypothetical protein